MSAREQGKAERRARIVAAARTLMQAASGDAFSMRALARVAGVSASTPYNLFGSRDAVLAALLDADFADYRRRLEQVEGDALDRLFGAIGLMGQMLDHDPAFHRNVVRALSGAQGGELVRSATGPRYALWKALIDAAVATDLIDSAHAGDPLAITMSQLIAANLLAWAVGRQGIEEFDARIRYGVALMLLGCVRDAGRERLRAERTRAQGVLESLLQPAQASPAVAVPAVRRHSSETNTPETIE